MRRILFAAATMAALPTATAQAGTYHVHSCGSYANNAWVATPAAGVRVDATCAGGTVGLSAVAGATMANSTAASLTFTSPAGTSIADFALDRQLDYAGPATADHHQYYALYAYGSTVFAGAGDYNDATRKALDAQKQWYGYPAGAAHLARATVARRTFPALASGSSNALALKVGCYNRGTPCSVASGGAINSRFYGADVTVSDPAPPAAMTVEASGLLSGGQRDGSDPVTVTASDATGIRRLELIDVTGAPMVVGAEDYAGAGTTDNGRRCDFSRPAPCPNLAREVIRPTSMPEGLRSLLVRVTDTGGNVADRGPFPINAITPSNRGAFNGAGATNGGTIQLGFTRSKQTRRTVGYGRRVGIAGRLRNSGGSPVAGAQVVVLTRDLRRGAQAVARRTVTTRADGSFSYRAAASASRLLQFAWRAHVNDTRFTTSSYLTLNVRASAELSVSTKRPRVGRLMTISGRMRGVDRDGVTVLVQGRARGAKKWETFADTTASRTGAFHVRYRFRASASRGRQFVFRARLRPGATSPYKTGYSNSATVRVR